jgi:hypothetical protein
LVWLFFNGTMLHDWSNFKDWSIEHTDVEVICLVVAGEKVVHWWGDERDNVYLTQTLRPEDVLPSDDLGVMSAGIEGKFIADSGVEYKGAMTQEMLAQRIDDLTRGNAGA